MIHATVDLDVEQTPDAGTRPCAHCGRPVPQRHAAGRPFRYCRDNDDACLRAARNARLRQRSSPGLAGQVAQAHEIMERLDRAAENLAGRATRHVVPRGRRWPARRAARRAGRRGRRRPHRAD